MLTFNIPPAFQEELCKVTWHGVPLGGGGCGHYGCPILRHCSGVKPVLRPPPHKALSSSTNYLRKMAWKPIVFTGFGSYSCSDMYVCEVLGWEAVIVEWTEVDSRSTASLCYTGSGPAGTDQSADFAFRWERVLKRQELRRRVNRCCRTLKHVNIF